MTAAGSHQRTIGWIGTGRMGFALASRLLEHGCDLSVYNRTRAKSEPLAARGARLVDRPADLSDRDIVLTSVAGSKDFAEVMTGPHGLLGNGTRVPSIVIDVSGNPKVARAGKLSLAVSGPRPAFEQALPYLQMLGKSVTYVGEGEAARLVKICHNLVLGVVTQILAETTVLAERGGIARADYLEFINGSVMGSIFSRYKTPAFVNLDFTPTFTGHLLRKDFELGLDAARQFNVPLPVAAITHQVVVSLIGQGLGDIDFAALLELEARGANLTLKPEHRDVSDGLKPEDGTTGEA